MAWFKHKDVAADFVKGNWGADIKKDTLKEHMTSLNQHTLNGILLGAILRELMEMNSAPQADLKQQSEAKDQRITELEGLVDDVTWKDGNCISCLGTIASGHERDCTIGKRRKR